MNNNIAGTLLHASVNLTRYTGEAFYRPFPIPNTPTVSTAVIPHFHILVGLSRMSRALAVATASPAG